MSSQIAATADNDDASDVLVTLSHERQRSTWDCGLACVLMALRKIRPGQFAGDGGDDFDRLVGDLRRDGVAQSVWTIDLCYLLTRYDVSYVFTTVTLGVDPTYSREQFYRRVLDRDERRVEERFNSAEQSGVTVRQKPSTLEEITLHLRRPGICIVLVNANLLGDRPMINPSSSPSSSLGGLLGNCCRKRTAADDDVVDGANVGTDDGRGKVSTAFQGHYILVVGYEPSDQRVVYHNPSRGQGPSRMSCRQFDAARTSHGTDQDVIYVDL